MQQTALAVYVLLVYQFMCPILHFHQVFVARMFSACLLSLSTRLFSTQSACLPIEDAVTLVWSTDTNLPDEGCTFDRTID